MVSSYEIQTAIAELIAATATDAKVLARNIHDVLTNAQRAMLISSTTGKLRGWVVSQSEDGFDEGSFIPGRATYKPRFEVWQFHEYDMGNDSSNSEKTFAEERDTVKAAFIGDLTGVLGTVGANPPSFSDIGLTDKYLGGRMLHIARGHITVTANESTACE